jgi:hypothetical protein
VRNSRTNALSSLRSISTLAQSFPAHVSFSPLSLIHPLRLGLSHMVSLLIPSLPTPNMSTRSAHSFHLLSLAPPPHSTLSPSVLPSIPCFLRPTPLCPSRPSVTHGECLSFSPSPFSYLSRVMEKTPHNVLAGAGAAEFARSHYHTHAYTHTREGGGGLRESPHRRGAAEIVRFRHSTYERDDYA